MCKKMICLFSFVLVLGSAGTAQGVPLGPDDGSISDNLCLWLRAPGTYFNPSTGVWSDLSPKGNDAEPVGNVDAWTLTYVAPTLSSGSNPLVFDNDFSTVKFAANTDDLMRATNLNGGVGPITPSTIRPVGFGSISGEGQNMGNNFNLSVDGGIRKDNGRVAATATHPDDQFFIRVARMNSTDIHQWFNSDGTLVQVHAAPGTAFITSTDNFYLGDLRAGVSTTIGGSLSVADIEIAEVVVYNSALSEAQIEGISEWLQANVGVVLGAELALNPSPPDGATDVPRDVSLSWMPGMYADKHDVYLGTNFSDVNDADRTTALGVLVSQNQDPTSYSHTELLQLGQTYYWRVDEVNAPPDNTIFKGNIWSFTAEPVAYPLAAESITPIASSSDVGRGPENTVNGSGLDDNDLHSITRTDMWLSSATGPQPSWIEFQFDNVYKLHEMWVWNSNESLESVLGLGFKDVTIEYSVNGIDYMTLGTTHEFAQATGAPDYAHNTTVDLGGVGAKHVRLTANTNWRGLLPQYGLSEVRFFYIPLRASEPSPNSGAIDVDLDATLSWRAGREAAQHDVYLGTDEQAVADGNVPVTTVTETSYGPLSLDLGQTYYWKVNEVNMAEIPTTLEGDIWNFATPEFLVVDDFESYNDLDPDDPESNRIFNAWIDGYEQPANGSIVGYAAPPFAEQSIVHNGGQSMPLFYDNSGTARYSEAELTLSPAQDWTKHGVNALSLWFSGDPNNVAEQMYVKFNGSKVTYDGDAGNLTLRPWQPWNIDLASLGIDLQNVTKFSIGLGDETSMVPGGLGVVYVDDIRLYPYSRQLATPAEPAPGNLVAHYEFEGTTNDSSANGLHGTVMGNPTFEAGKVGQAINLRGLNDYVEITGYKGILGPNAVTVTAWINTTTTGTGTIVGWGPNVSGQRFGFRINADRLRIEHAGGNVQGDTSVNDGGWHHVAVTIQENATLSYPDVILYVDGIDDTRATQDPDAFDLTADQDVRIGSRPASNDRFFMGMIDDVRIYDRELTQEEIAWLAGRTESFDKPF
ncbi:MAG: LamG domain-containing protein [Planctomycetota bacterium]|jgi:hypothetical protein